MSTCVVAFILPRVKHGAGSLRRRAQYASLLPWSGLIDSISGAPVNGISQTQLASEHFEQPDENDFFRNLVEAFLCFL